MITNKEQSDSMHITKDYSLIRFGRVYYGVRNKEEFHWTISVIDPPLYIV